MVVVFEVEHLRGAAVVDGEASRGDGQRDKETKRKEERERREEEVVVVVVVGRGASHLQCIQKMGGW